MKYEVWKFLDVQSSALQLNLILILSLCAVCMLKVNMNDWRTYQQQNNFIEVW